MTSAVTGSESEKCCKIRVPDRPFKLSNEGTNVDSQSGRRPDLRMLTKMLRLKGISVVHVSLATLGLLARCVGRPHRLLFCHPLVRPFEA